MAVAVWTLDGRDLGNNGGDTVGRSPNLCMAYLLGQSMAVSLPANASADVDGSPSPMPMGGGRSYPDKRRHLRLPQLSRPRPRSMRTGSEDPSTAPQQMSQLPLLLAPSSDLLVAKPLPALPRIPPPREGLQAVQDCDVGDEGWQPATPLCL